MEKAKKFCNEITALIVLILMIGVNLYVSMSGKYTIYYVDPQSTHVPAVRNSSTGGLDPSAAQQQNLHVDPMYREEAVKEGDDKTRRTVFLWGIETGSSPLEATRRQVIRQSYLGIYQNSTTPHRICPLSRLLFDPDNYIISSGCQVAYTFFQVVSSTTTNDMEHDIVYLEAPETSVSGINNITAWFRYASSLEIPFDYIAKVDSDTIMLPDLLLSEAIATNEKHPKKSAPPPTSEYAATGTDDESLDCLHIPGNECHSFNGRFYYLSRDLASLVGRLDHDTITTTSNSITTRSLADNDVNYTKPEEEIILQLLKRRMTKTTAAADAPSSIKRVKQKYLGRLLTRKEPTAFLNQWQTYRNATHAFQKLQRDYNTSITYVTGKFGRHAPFQHAIRNANNWVVMASGLPPHQVHAHSFIPDFISNDKRWERHLEFLTNETAPNRGGGYWFWKGPLIQHYFDKLRDGDILIFADADVLDGWGWTHDLLKTMLGKQGTTFALYETDFPLRRFTKRDILRKYCGRPVSKTVGPEQKIYSANFLVFIKSPGTTRLVQDWTDGLADFHLVSDDPSVAPNYKMFQGNRHDQSILSTVLRCQYKDTGKELFHGAFTLRDWTLPMFRI